MLDEVARKRAAAAREDAELKRRAEPGAAPRAPTARARGKRPGGR